MHDWKGKSNYTLERFVDEHHNSFVSMQAASGHVKFQITNEHSHIG